MIFSTKLFFVLILLLQAPSFLMAQEGSGQLQGVVTDSITGEPLFGANVWLKGYSLGSATNADGKYIINKIPPGSYTLTVRYIGYREKETSIEVIGGTTLEINISLSGEIIEGEVVTVTAQAQGQREAINQQLSSNTIKNVVSSERIRELPDESAATALSRLPGLSLMEGDKVVIRGIESRLNTVLINGVQLPSTDMEDRSTNLGFISSNMLAGIEVTKVLTPDMDANSIGGVVNLRLKEAPEGFHFDILTQGGYNTLDETSDNYQLWGSVSNRFFDNKLGVFVQANARRLDVGNEYGDANFELLGNDLGYGEATYGMSEFAYGDEVKIVKEYGGNLILDFALPNGKLVLQNFIAFADSDLARHRNLLFFESGQRQYTITRDIHSKKLFANALQGQHILGDLNIDYSLSHSYNDKATDLRYGDEGENFAFADQSGNVRTFEPLDRPEDRIHLTPEDVYNMQLNDSDWVNASIFQFAGTRDEAFNQRVLNGSFNLTLPVSFTGDFSSKFKAGGKINYIKRENDVERYYARVTDVGQNRGAADFLRSIGQDPDQALQLRYFLDNDYDRGDFLDGKYDMKYVIKTEYMDEYMRLAPPFWRPQGRHLSDSKRNDFTGDETVTAGYLMGEFNVGPRLSLITGVRYEHYNMDYNANFVYETHGVDGTANIPDTLNTIDRSYDHWFPNLQIRYKLTDWFDVRLAYSKSISRPDYIMILPNIYVQSRNAGRAGNPYLNPAVSQNLDAFFSFYNNQIGLFTIGGFYKKIEDEFFQIIRLYRVLPEGVAYPDLEVFRALNFAEPFESAQITTYYNNPNPAHVRGLEFEWQTNFWYLPNPFNSIVLNINYTRVWSEMDYEQIRLTSQTVQNPTPPPFTITVWNEVDTIRTARLFNQGDHILNVALGADYEGFSFRISYRLQGNVITNVGVRPEADEFTGDVHRWDFNIRQRLPIEGLSLFLSGINITNAVDENFSRFRRDVNQSVHDNLARSTYSPRRFELGVRYSL